eukprot:TRINITY_DN51873_c0_g1_i1.p1 TRINITY_DN51873_c0_g1~~TRINITY_DN51873_c0_g1_i1.p1  ORF type:complete len:403 (+),score=78.89 TRINITY_DN51873_c0_g1_i1:82-1209(+)
MGRDSASGRGSGRGRGLPSDDEDGGGGRGRGSGRGSGGRGAEERSGGRGSGRGSRPAERPRAVLVCPAPGRGRPAGGRGGDWPSSSGSARRPWLSSATHTIEDLKRENDFLAAQNLVVCEELDKVIRANDVLRPAVRAKEELQQTALANAVADLQYAQDCLDAEQAREDAEARERAELEAAAAFGGSIVRVDDGSSPPGVLPVVVGPQEKPNKPPDPEDPNQNWEALLQLYCQVHSIAVPSPEHVYENYLTKASFSIDNPTGQKVTVRSGLPGRPPPGKLKARLIEETMKLCYPGKSQREVVEQLKLLQGAREQLKKERAKMQARALYEQVTGFSGSTSGSSQLSASSLRSMSISSGRGLLYSPSYPPAYVGRRH